MKGLGVPKIGKEIKFEGVWDELELKTGFETVCIILFALFVFNSS